MLLALSASSCATPPKVIVDASAATQASVTPQASDGRRILAPAEAAAVVRKIERRSRTDTLARHLAVVESHVQEPLLTGNRARLLVDGPQTHEAMFAAIETARHSIELETYILESGSVGERLAAALVRKRAQGVNVRLLYDAVGSLTTDGEFFERLKAQGIALCVFNPIKPTEANKDLTLNNRDHRKILVVDRRIAFTGGINISGVYASGSFGSGRRAPADDLKKDGWRDTHIELHGPVVDDLLKLFDDAWSKQHCEGPAPARALPPPRPAGDEVMRVIAQDPQADRNEFYVEVLSAIGHAEEDAWLTFGYFVPDPQTVEALKAAARRGVDVRILVPGQSDVWLTLYAGRSHYAGLLEAGVRIFERQDAVLHAKTAVVDKVWSTVGSSNLDWRSFVHNFEVNVVILGPDMATQLRKLFERDLAASKEITAKAWAERGVGSRMKEAFSRLWAYFL
jgi:cardiolipin synthase